MSSLNKLSAEIFIFAFALGFACYVGRMAYEMVQPMLWLLCPLLTLFVIGGVVWRYVRYRDRYWG